MLNLFDLAVSKAINGGGGGGSTVTVEPLTVTQNGTQTAPAGKAYSPVTVNVPQPSGTKNIPILQNGATTENVENYANVNIGVNVQPKIVYNSVERETSTLLSNPFSKLDFSELYDRLQNKTYSGILWFEFNGMMVQVELYARNNIIGGMAFTTDPAVVGVECEWNASGVVTLDALMGGQVQDMTSYAPMIPCTFYIYGTTEPTPAT